MQQLTSLDWNKIIERLQTSSFSRCVRERSDPRKMIELASRKTPTRLQVKPMTPSSVAPMMCVGVPADEASGKALLPGSYLRP